MNINISNLSKIIDTINEAHFYKLNIPKEDRNILANAIVSKQAGKYAYGNLYSISEKERNNGIRLFTGEKISYSARARHVCGEEALRALKLLNIKDKTVNESINSASHWMEERLIDSEEGFYCCKGCTPSVWRAIGADVYKKIDKEAWIVKGVKKLKQYRDGEGRWGAFPYYYTLLSLMEFDFKDVRNEIIYSKPVLEKIIREKPGSVYQRRRIDIAERILNKFS